MFAQCFSARRMNATFNSRPATITLLSACLAAVAVTAYSTNRPLLARATAPPIQSAQVAIHDIQGSGGTSPFAGQSVTTSGVLTGVTANGFFLQLPDRAIDSDSSTSEGIFVFTSGPPPAFSILGSWVEVTGTVVEFRPSSDPNSPTLTQLHPTTINRLDFADNPLPAPINLTAANVNPAGSIDQLEKFEGMRVRVGSLTVVAPTDGDVDERTATSTSNGVFYGVITGTARPFREPGIQVPDPLPAGSPCCVPRFDGNPERLRVDSDRLSGTSAIDVSTGATITNLVGVMDYSSRTYTILPYANALSVTPGISAAAPVLAPAADEFTVASFNLERFFDTTDDPGVSDVPLTSEAFDNRLSKASLAIRNVMRSPDIIGVQEVENLATLQSLAGRINTDALFAGQPRPDYFPLLIEGNDPGGIDVGFLVKGSRATLQGITQEGKNAMYVNPNTGAAETLNDRPPLVLRVNLQAPGGFGFPVTIIVNHLRSLSGIDDPADGVRVRAKRRAQAEYLASVIRDRQAADPNERIIVIGDFNAFQFNDGYVDVVGTVAGAPSPINQVVLPSSDIIIADLTNVTDQVALDQRYSFVFDGNAQTLDHILVSQNMVPRVTHVEYAHSNADFPESLRNDPNRPERISDHDMPVAYFKLSPPATDLSLTKMGTPDAVRAGGEITYTIKVTNNGTSDAPEVLVSDPVGIFGTRFVSVTPTQGSCAPPSLGDRGTVLCRLGPLAAGASAHVTLVVKADVVSSLPVTVTNTAIASAVIGGQFNQTLASANTTVLPVPTIQSATLSGKKLRVNGFNFQQGAVVEINGVGQKTKNDAEMPNFVLIAKKGGKKIAAGETATLTALNPDGVRSAPFSFTKPVQ